LTRAVPVIAIGWLMVGLAAAMNSNFSDRWFWAPMGLGWGTLVLLADRPTRLTFERNRRAMSIARPRLARRPLVSEWPVADIAEARVILHRPAEPFGENWNRGRIGLVLLHRSGEQIPIVERTYMNLDTHRDRINALLASFAGDSTPV
jgi:hypothetical protein